MGKALVLAAVFVAGLGCAARNRDGYYWEPYRSLKRAPRAEACRWLRQGDVDAMRAEGRIELVGWLTTDRAEHAARGCKEQGGTHAQHLGRLATGEECESRVRPSGRVTTRCGTARARENTYEIYVVRPR